MAESYLKNKLKKKLRILIKDKEMIDLLKKLCELIGCATSTESAMDRKVLENEQKESEECKKELELAQKNNKQLANKKQELEEENTNLTSEIHSLGEERRTLEERPQIPDDVKDTMNFVWQDEVIMRQFKLPEAGPTDNYLRLTAMVAIFSQANNIERLWETYKKRCENGRRRLTDKEYDLLRNAVDWANNNWPDKPYILYEPKNKDRYDYEQHIRCVGMTGDAVIETWVPGIEGMSKVKPLVCTQ